MREPVISVVIPCFNSGLFLPEAVASVTELHNKDVELIVVDDGSTDERTLRELDKIAAHGIEVVRQENKGLGAARNAGIRRARGEFILPLDSDNRLRENYFLSGLKKLQSEASVAVVYAHAEYFGGKTGLWQVPEFDLCRLTKTNFIDACALYRRSVWESVQGYDEQMPWMGYEDWDFWLRSAVRGWRFSRLDEVAFDYRVRSGSMLGQTDLHSKELADYIFAKPQNQVAKLIREQTLELEWLRKQAWLKKGTTAHQILGKISSIRRKILKKPQP